MKGSKEICILLFAFLSLAICEKSVPLFDRSQWGTIGEPILVGQSLTENPFWVVGITDDEHSSHLITHGIWSLHTTTLFRHIFKNCSSEKLVVDVGANVCYFTLLAASYGCRVISFEPQLLLNKMCQIAIHLNGFGDRVTLHRNVVGENHGDYVEMPMDGKHPGHMQVGGEGDKGSVKTEVVRLDKIIPENAKILLLKMDIEGYEDHGLKGLQNFNGEIENYHIEISKFDAFRAEWVDNKIKQGYIADVVVREVWWPKISNYTNADRIYNMNQTIFWRFDKKMNGTPLSKDYWIRKPHSHDIYSLYDKNAFLSQLPCFDTLNPSIIPLVAEAELTNSEAVVETVYITNSVDDSAKLRNYVEFLSNQGFKRIYTMVMTFDFLKKSERCLTLRGRTTIKYPNYDEISKEFQRVFYFAHMVKNNIQNALFIQDTTQFFRDSFKSDLSKLLQFGVNSADVVYISTSEKEEPEKIKVGLTGICKDVDSFVLTRKGAENFLQFLPLLFPREYLHQVMLWSNRWRGYQAYGLVHNPPAPAYDESFTTHLMHELTYYFSFLYKIDDVSSSSPTNNNIKNDLTNNEIL